MLLNFVPFKNFTFLCSLLWFFILIDSIPIPPTSIWETLKLESNILFINLFVAPILSDRVIEIIIKSGLYLLAKAITESEGTEGAILETEYPLLLRKGLTTNDEI